LDRNKKIFNEESSKPIHTTTKATSLLVGNMNQKIKFRDHELDKEEEI
jgi:hypothetical protein